ncbi:MAG: hypothetical protein IIC95_08875 [Chloroflexi bacterium]|nr:hypothetical protein [Chloroflexota bacterium]
MILFKSCPKCTTGDLMKSEDLFGEYMECLQCGYMKDLAAPARSVVPVPAPVPVPVEVTEVTFEPPRLSA